MLLLLLLLLLIQRVGLIILLLVEVVFGDQNKRKVLQLDKENAAFLVFWVPCSFEYAFVCNRDFIDTNKNEKEYE